MRRRAAPRESSTGTTSSPSACSSRSGTSRARTASVSSWASSRATTASRSTAKSNRPPRTPTESPTADAGQIATTARRARLRGGDQRQVAAHRGAAQADRVDAGPLAQQVGHPRDVVDRPAVQRAGALAVPARVEGEHREAAVGARAGEVEVALLARVGAVQDDDAGGRRVTAAPARTAPMPGRQVLRSRRVGQPERCAWRGIMPPRRWRPRRPPSPTSGLWARPSTPTASCSSAAATPASSPASSARPPTSSSRTTCGPVPGASWRPSRRAPTTSRSTSPPSRFRPPRSCGCSRRRGWPATSPPAASCTWRSTRASTPRRSTCTATPRARPSCGWRWTPASATSWSTTSSSWSGSSAGPGRRPAADPAAGRARRQPRHPPQDLHRRAEHQVRVQPGRRRGRDRARAALRPARPRRPALPHRLADPRPRAVPRRAGGGRAARRLQDLQHGRRPRRRLHPRAVRAGDRGLRRAQGRRSCARSSARASGSPTSRVARSSPTRPSPCTRWSRSSTTWWTTSPSTAGCRTTCGRCSTTPATRRWWSVGRRPM